ncbi:MAG: hypothetical protein ACI9A7_001625 [Cyclobacteriaceae bacterium]
MTKRSFIAFVYILVWLTLIPVMSTAQDFPAPRLHIQQAQGEMLLDGILNEPDWDLAEPTSHFYQIFPTDTAMALSNTVVKLTYDEEFLYVGIAGYDLEPGDYTIQSYKRDFFGSQNDVVNIVIDPYSDQTNAFLFGLSPFGVMREAFLNSQAESSRDAYSWDNKWYAKAKIHDGYWTGEMAIPFKTLRYKPGVEKWKVNFYRLDTKQNERSSWNRIPRGYGLTSLAFTGDLIWDKPLKKRSGGNISLIPYVAGGVQRDYEAGTPRNYTSGIGGDVKVGLTPSLNLDMTINPDFSQVEVDEQVTNLSRFEIFFPEKRQFFLENADLFDNFGSSDALPFFSRRIGIAYDSALEQNVQSRVLFGARLSGKLNANWRIGLLSAQMERQSDIELPAINYAVGVIQRRLFKTSNISAIFTNKDGLSVESENAKVDYNRIIGADYNLNSADGIWKGKAFYHQSMTPENLENQNTHGGFLEYRVSRVRLSLDYLSVGENYTADIGFIPRVGFRRFAPEADFNIYPKGSIINRHTFKLSGRRVWNERNEITDKRLKTGYELYFSNNYRLQLDVNSGWIRLLSAFDPTNSGGEKLQEGSSYNYLLYSLTIRSNTLKPFSVELTNKGGKYYNGRRFGNSGKLNYRLSPIGIFSMTYSYDYLKLPEPYAQERILLLGSNIEVALNKKVFFNALVQYNNQIDNFNINARMQWRFKPASDFFLVYTDNYLPENFEIKNRSIVAKLTYWFSL